MRLIPGQLTYGVAPELLCELAMQLRWKSEITLQFICESLGATENEIAPVIAGLVQDGYLQHADRGRYAATQLMNQLALASISADGLSRKDAAELLQFVITRAKEINSGQRICNGAVLKLAVFGSFLDESKQILGDLDIAYEWKPPKHHSSPKRITKLRNALRGSNKQVSIHELGEVEDMEWPHRIIFEDHS